MILLAQLEIYQWLAPIIGVFFIYRTIAQYVSRKRTLVAAIVWISFWISITLMAIIPNPVSMKIASVLGFRSNVTAVIFVSIALLFLFVFYLSSTIEKLEHQMTDLVRKIAIEDKRRKDAEEKDEISIPIKKNSKAKAG
jgi:hypothetical protein